MRLTYTLGWQDVDSFGGDPRYYHEAANLLASGHGFLHPFARELGVDLPGADHPPGYVVLLAIPSALGLGTVTAHQVTSCIVGAVTVWLVGLLGRRLAGPRAGLIAAGLAAAYPNLWIYDAAVMSETLAMCLAVAVSLLALRAWDHPGRGQFVALGAAIGAATLARAEGLMLLGILVLPLVARVPQLAGWRPRLDRVAVATAASLAVLAPWVVANLVRFEHPSTLSTQLGPTLEVANCDDTYSGRLLGSWSIACASPWSGTTDRSTLDLETRERALDYVGEHRDRVPIVVAARLGRTWGLYVPAEQIEVDAFSEARPLPLSQVGLGCFYVVAAGAIVGFVVLRARGVPTLPVTVWILNVTITVALVYGSTRFRAPAEPSLVVLAAVGVDALLRARAPAPPTPSEA